VIIQEARVEGRVTVMSRRPIDTGEAVELLNTVLKEKGYAAIRNGRTLKIVTLDEAKKSSIPVYAGNDPAKIQPTDELITQVIPIRFGDAVRLRTDLSSLIPAYASLTSNAASNALILTDTKANVRRIVQIVQALDQHMASEVEVKVFPLQYANASATARLITQVFREERAQQAQIRIPFFGRMGRPGRGGDSGGGQRAGQGRQEQRVVASGDDRTNTLVVSAPPDLMKVIENVVKELDANPALEQDVFHYPLKNAQAKNLETVLNDIFSESTRATGGGGVTARTISTRFGGRSRTGRTTQRISAGAAAAAADLAGEVYIVADEDSNSLLVRTASKNIERVKQIIAELDRAVRQVLIKVLIAEVTHSKSLDLGAEFSVLNVRMGTGSASISTDFSVAAQSGGLIYTFADAEDFTATIRALEGVGKLDVLSRPYILASDNQEASITVGQEVPFIRNTRTTDTGQTINTIEYEDIGIILNVTPHVNPDGLVVLDVAPEISTLTGETVPISETVNAPVFAKRSAQTRVAVPNGQTIVIGGLMEDRITDTIQKVPLLGDIPLLGALFRRTIQSKAKTELLVFLTPHVAQQPADLKAISEDEVAGSQTVRKAMDGNAFDRHIKGMQRGATTRPAGGSHGPKP
jgi:general secretion pathway protein D